MMNSRHRIPRGATSARAVLLAFGTAFAAAPGDPDPATLDKKVLLGYQGWFTCPGDGTGRWTHWSRGMPAPDTLTVDMYPDLSEFEADELCAAPGMTIGGKPAYLFSSRNRRPSAATSAG